MAVNVLRYKTKKCGPHNVLYFPIYILFVTLLVNNKFNEKQYSGSRIFTCVQTDKHGEGNRHISSTSFGEIMKIHVHGKYRVLFCS